MGIREQQREATRQALVAAARSLFTEHGYGAVGLAEIVRAAGVTKGALYHHFESKAALFHAVLERVQAEVATTVAATADAESDPWRQLIAGCRAFLTASTDPSVQRIMLLDGPAVLGWHAWRALDDQNSARHLTDALTALVDAGVLAAQPVEPVARLLSGAMNEAVLWLATTDSASDDLDRTVAALTRMLDGLRADHTAG
jgi:AcrR family transcriptional regulator